MHFKFSKHLEYQQAAIDAVVGIFDTGKNLARENKVFRLTTTGSVIGNELEIDEQRILKNVQSIQKLNNISSVSERLGSMDFSIEMETGTGKTYVYLRTILELNKVYGLKKFIILVPSVAIREGVLKTLQQTKGHFREMYNVGVHPFAYDSGKLSLVREFAQSLDVQVMIMTIQSFNSDDRVMRSTPDRFQGESPIAMVAATNPVVIMDELRYSATHKELHNLMYRLTPVDAYRQGLVKKIQVFGVKENDAGAFVLRVQSIETKKGISPKAKVMIEIKNASGDFSPKEVVLKAGDDLFKKSGKNAKYSGLAVSDVNAQFNRVELSDGNFYKLEAETENKTEIFRTQIRETIKAHMDKQQSLESSIKVLSLFFIDKVENYVHTDSLIRTIFHEEFDRLKKNYPAFQDKEAAVVQKGYFASKKEKGQMVFQDTRGDSKLDKDAYDLIMKEKERLLSFSEPVSFIFSHSALKEGWDNPNVFQICTLRDTNSFMKKRQEIGRGMRLPVDVNGDRVFDPQINVLTVVANESYQEYVSKLQQEFTDAGYKDVPETMDAKQGRITVKVLQKYIETEEFKELWKRIRTRTKYRIDIEHETLVRKAVERLNTLDASNPVISVEKVFIAFDEGGKVKTVFGSPSVGARIERDVLIGNVMERIARETGLSKHTIQEILARATESIEILFSNPEEYVRSAIKMIQASMGDLVMNEGLKYYPSGEMWEVSLFKDFETFAAKSIACAKSVFDRVAWQSNGEREFAQSLSQSANVKVFTKLPSGFVIDTPLGNYNPDWAIVWSTNPNEQGGEKLYLVRESKFDYQNLERDLPFVEQAKILCGEKHFEAIGADFKVVQKKDLRDIIKK
ncbi:MAG: DEAD/DEAH box helicase family protein [Candidatus Uhrbacteria bacterium]|nr:DEAD/DEAH box helicase family protein [Candidatus Uhrbacteria bacterium]